MRVPPSVPLTAPSVPLTARAGAPATQRRVGPLLLALAGAAALPPPPALAGLAAYDVTGKGVLEASVALGDANNALAFVPSELSFQQGRVYKLRVTNPSAVEHYFSAPTFASKVFTILVEVGGAEVKGAVTEVALEPGASLSWVFVPMKPGRYPLLCPVAGHVEGGMVGSIVVTPA
jgi:uncharacterized cupredoxin-like copper-binding protein